MSQSRPSIISLFDIQETKMLSTPSGVKYVRLPASELGIANDLPDILRAMPLRAPVVLIMPHAPKLDWPYFHECFDKIIKENGWVCLLARRAWVGYSDGKIVVNTLPTHSRHQWRGERFYRTNGTEDMYVFNLNTEKHIPESGSLDSLAYSVLSLAPSAA